MRVAPRWKAIAVIACATFLGAADLSAQAPQAAESVDVLIGFQQQPGPAEQALVRAFGGIVKHTYHIVPAIAATVPQAAISGLHNHPAVTVVEMDTEIFALDAELDNSWGVKRIGAGTIHDGGNWGGGVKVCVIDSGIQTNHPDLWSNYTGGYDFVNGDNDPSDDNGHGTHVSGTVAALKNATGVVGVAPSARIYAYKVLSSSGSGSFSNVIAALDACVNIGGQVTNNSYGSSGDPGSLVRAAFDNSYKNYNLLHVAAAGNAGTSAGSGDNVGYPAKYDSVIAVAATNKSDARTSWSSTGPAVEIAAPGASILSTYPGSTYAYMSGTSMASPHVAGTAALVIATGVTSASEVRTCLQQTAQDLGSTGRDPWYGYGLVRADLAVGCNPSNPAPPASPSNLSAYTVSSSQIDLNWTDNSNDEDGFQIERCQGSDCTNFSQIAVVGANTQTYSNPGLSESTTYRYRVRAYNGAGNSDYSNIASATTDSSGGGGSISLTATGYKDKGLQKANLSWSGATSTNVDIYRNGGKITTTANTGSYTDHINNRGGGSYTYQVCEAGTATCSNTATVTF